MTIFWPGQATLGEIDAITYGAPSGSALKWS